MLMSHEHKWIFCHIPKAAGTSIRVTLRPYADVEGCSDNYRKKGVIKTYDQYFKYDVDFFIHESLWDICEISKKKKDIDVSDYFKFSFVRNPWDLVLSLYLYKKRESKVTGELRQYYADNYLKQTSNGFGWFVKNCMHDQKLQSWFLRDEECDFIGKFENLDEDFTEVCRRIGLPQIKLPACNKTEHKHYAEYYDEETKQIVADKYAKDIEYFNYKFD